MLDTALFAELIDKFAHPRVQAIRDRVVQDSLWSDHPEVLDDWSACGLKHESEIPDLFTKPFYFGCEGDDRMVAAAFDATAESVRCPLERHARLGHRPLRCARHA